MLNEIYDKIVELTVAGLKRKQRSITRLFPAFHNRVDQVKAKGGIRLVKVDNAKHLWTFKVHSGTDNSLWYTDYVQFKNLPDMIAMYVKDKKLWNKDKSKVDYSKLAKQILAKVDVAVSCSCPAFKYYGADYVLSLDKYAAKYGDPEKRAPIVRNPKQYGALCKHLHAVMMVALPFYTSTFAKFLKDNYGEIVSKYEQAAKTATAKPKDAETAIAKKKKEIDTKGAEEDMKKNATKQEDEKEVSKEDAKKNASKKKSLDKTKQDEEDEEAPVESTTKQRAIIADGYDWQKTGTHTCALFIRNYRISIAEQHDEQLYDIVIDEVWPDTNDMWRFVEHIGDIHSFVNAKKVAEAWIQQHVR